MKNLFYVFQSVLGKCGVSFEVGPYYTIHLGDYHSIRVNRFSVPVHTGRLVANFVEQYYNEYEKPV